MKRLITADYIRGRRAAERGIERLTEQGDDWLRGYDSVSNGSHIIKRDEPALEAERMTAGDALVRAGTIVTGGRQTTHGRPERSFEHIAKRWSLTLGVEVSPRQVALMMADLKMVRAIEGVTTGEGEDHIVDLIGYAALSIEFS